MPQVLKHTPVYQHLHFYQKSDAIYQLTYIFCQRFLPKYGDRTVDQMLQAARSGKQNIVEGIEDGVASSEMEIKLLNVARASLQELREDYEDFLHTRQLLHWTAEHERYSTMLAFCKNHNLVDDYLPFANKWTAEEFCNTLVTLCHITDRMLTSFLSHLEQKFLAEGGIRERMYAARHEHRLQQSEQLAQLQAENESLKAIISKLKTENANLLQQLAASKGQPL